MEHICRQLSEGLAIESHDTEHLINGKGEYGSKRIPRFKMTLENEILGKFSNPKPQISKNSVLHNPIDENPKRRNPDTNGDYFSTQFKQRKRAKKAASISTESLNLCNMPQTQHRHPGMQCTDTSFYSNNSCGSLNVKSSLDNRKGFDNNKKGITQSKSTKVFKFGSS